MRDVMTDTYFAIQAESLEFDFRQRGEEYQIEVAQLLLEEIELT